MNKKNYILNNADTRYFEYFFLKRLRYDRSVVINIDEEGTDYSVTVPKDVSFDAIKLKGDTNQTTYSGKNLYIGSPSFAGYQNISSWEDGGTYNGMPVIKKAGSWAGAFKLVDIVADKTYTFSTWIKSDQEKSVAIYATGGSTGATAVITPGSKTITTSTDWERVTFTFTCSTSGSIALRFENTTSSTTNYTYISGYQLEESSTATSYEPYVGAIASPNPDYPQDVNVVSGSQTIAITSDGNTQQYPITLGSAELCKIGDYQDYIYKDGDDWYVHKEISKIILNGTGDYAALGNGSHGEKRFRIIDSAVGNIPTSVRGTYCDKYQGVTQSSSVPTPNSISQWSQQNMLLVTTNKTTYSIDDFKADLATSPATVYCVGSEATNTKITDSTLILQLNALFASGLKSGVNTIKVTAPSGLLPTIFNIIINH